MKIKRTSWHYKVRHFGRDSVPYNDTLCSYFWGLIWTPVAIFGVISLVIILAYAFFKDPLFISNTIFLVWLLSSIILPPLTISYIRKKVGKAPEMPYENIFVEYLKAKKHKVCPLIEYID